MHAIHPNVRIALAISADITRSRESSGILARRYDVSTAGIRERRTGISYLCSLSRNSCESNIKTHLSLLYCSRIIDVQDKVISLNVFFRQSMTSTSPCVRRMRMVARVRQAPGERARIQADRTDPAEPAMRVLLTLIPLASFATDVLAADLLPRAAPPVAAVPCSPGLASIAGSSPAMARSTTDAPRMHRGRQPRERPALPGAAGALAAGRGLRRRDRDRLHLPARAGARPRRRRGGRLPVHTDPLLRP